MADVLAFYPGAPLALFQRYRIGSRERYGFGPEESLVSVLRRHLLFDTEEVIQFLEESRRQEDQLGLEPAEIKLADFQVVDVRGPEDHRRAALPASRLLTAETAQALDPSRPVLFYCAHGLQAPAATRLFRRRGLSQAFFLRGGLEGWALQADPTFPLVASQARPPGRWVVLPAVNQVRFGSPQLTELDKTVLIETDQDSKVARWLERPEVTSVALSRNWVTVVTTEGLDWPARCQVYEAIRKSPDQWVTNLPEPRSDRVLRQRLRDCLAHDVAPALRGHKGTVELESFEDGWARLRLGGGCQGCSSAAITVHQEIAAVLHRAVPELVGLADETDHAAGRTPYQGPDLPPRMTRATGE